MQGITEKSIISELQPTLSTHLYYCFLDGDVLLIPAGGGFEHEAIGSDIDRVLPGFALPMQQGTRLFPWAPTCPFLPFPH